LPEAAAFCAACGRRIEGWSAAPKGAARPAVLPLLGADEATQKVDPTPSLLRAIAVRVEAPNPPPETESAMLRAVRARRPPIWLASVGLGMFAAGASFVVAKRSRAPNVVIAEPAEVEAPVAPVKSAAALLAPLPVPRPSRRAKRAGPHRIEALTIPTRATRPGPGGLPHKGVATESRPAPAVQPEGSAKPAQSALKAPSTAPTAPIEDLPSGAEPMTEEEMKQQAEASIDADGVRFVVKAHLPQVHACYGRAFKDGSPGGRVEVGFAINRNGRAERVRTETNTTDSEQLARCLEARIGEWQFPRPVGGDFELVYPFVFSPGS
jgi:hypothetical protein